MFFKNKVKNGKHVYNIENLNIKTNLDCTAFTSLLSISSSSFTYGTPQDIITTSWSKHWLYEGESNSQVHLRPHILWNTPFQLLFSTNTTSLFTGLSKYWVELSDLSEAPSNSLTLQTLPLLSLYAFTIRAIDHRP